MDKLLFFYRQHCTQCKATVFKLLRRQFWGLSPHGPIWSTPPCQISTQ